MLELQASNDPEHTGRSLVVQSMSPSARTDDRVFRWTGRAFYVSTLVGLGAFGTYIIVRASGLTSGNFLQWHDLVAGLPLLTAADWIANVGIGMHFFMGMVLVLVWPILFSTRIRARHRSVHRWTGRVYVTAGFLAGTGGLSYILARHTGEPAHIAFALWGSLMMLSAVQAYVHGRAKRFDQHRAWAIRLFAMVLGAWLYDLEAWAWMNLASGVGMTEKEDGPVDYLLFYFFFLPNLLVAEFFIRNKQRQAALPSPVKWSLWTAAAITIVIFVYTIVLVTATNQGKFGKHLLDLVAS